MARRLALVALAIVSLSVTACQSSAPVESSPGATSDSSAASPEAPATFDPNGTAESNKAYFDATNRQTLAANAKASSRDLVNGLRDAGFDANAMQVTADKTPTGLDVDYVIVSVKMGNECLLGQRAVEGYTSKISPVLSTGECLIGQTQAIDW